MLNYRSYIYKHSNIATKLQVLQILFLEPLLYVLSLASSALNTCLDLDMYLSPKLSYVRVNVIEANDLQPSDKRRSPEVFVRAQLGNQVLRTRISPLGTVNPLWNEDLMFVVVEPFDEPLILSVEDRVAPDKDEILGRCKIPFQRSEEHTSELQSPC